MLAAMTTGVAAQTPAPPAGDTAPSQPVRYDAAFFAKYSPRTALDIVTETPGFVLAKTDDASERRGFAEAVGNVLIDGQRPSAKSQTLTDILQRIPASQVVYVEIRRGAEVAGDASGQTVLLNVVLAHLTSHGAWSAGFEYANRDRPMPNGSLSWAGKHGASAFSLGASTYSFLRDLPDTRQIRNSSEELTSHVTGASPRDFFQGAVNGDVTHPFLGGQLRLTGEVFRSRYHDDTTETVTSSSNAILDLEDTPYTEWNRTLEGGAALTRALHGWDMTVLGLVTRKRFRNDVTDTHGEAPVFAYTFNQAATRRSGETIGRLTLTRRVGTHQFQLAGEFAGNSLTSHLALTGTAGGAPIVLTVPNADVTVAEAREETMIGDAWHAASGWSVEARLAQEASRLRVHGDTDRAVTLAYWKPSLQIGRRVGERSQVMVRILRQVGQLDFTQFASAASLADMVIKGGNPDLRPERSWRLEGTTDVRTAGDVAVALTLFHAWLRDVLDVIPWGPAGGQIDAPGNIGAGALTGATFSIRTSLQRIVPRASLSMSGTLQRSSVTDPVTRQRRTISDVQNGTAKVEFRDDLTRVSWGITHSLVSSTTEFRLDEIDRHRDSPSLDAFVETSVHPFKIRVSAQSILGSPEHRDRTFFVTDRTGAISSVETRQRWPGYRWQVSASRTF